MSNDEMLAKPKKKIGPVSSFVVEADHPTNCDIVIQTLGNIRLRSAIKQTKEISDREDGELITRTVSARLIEGLPRNIPGMRLHVNPAECTWKCVDPMRDDQETLDRIQRAVASQTGIKTRNKLRGVPTREGKLDVDEMKTLVRELLCLIDSEAVRIVKGIKPDMEDIDDMPGRYLLNWSNQGHWNQPRYEDEMDEWKRQLNRMA